MNQKNTLLIIIGVTALGLLFFGVGFLKILFIIDLYGATPGKVQQFHEKMRIMAWSTYFFAAMIVFGIYKNWHR